MANVFPRVRPGGVFAGTHATVASLIWFAYDVKEFQISGGPEWIRRSYFDINARAESPDASVEQIRLMVQSLLAERFKLATHWETREMRQLALVLTRPDGRPGPNLVSLDECTPVVHRKLLQKLTAFPSGITTGCQIGHLADLLSIRLETPVIDGTGLDGEFFFFLRSPMLDAQPGGRYIAEPDSSLPTALEEDLGLKLESRRAPIDVLVIDSVERPTEN